jgi:hypothetical protein
MNTFSIIVMPYLCAYAQYAVMLIQERLMYLKKCAIMTELGIINIGELILCFLPQESMYLF